MVIGGTRVRVRGPTSPADYRTSVSHRGCWSESQITEFESVRRLEGWIRDAKPRALDQWRCDCGGINDFGDGCAGLTGSRATPTAGNGQHREKAGGKTPVEEQGQQNCICSSSAQSGWRTSCASHTRSPGCTSSLDLRWCKARTPQSYRAVSPVPSLCRLIATKRGQNPESWGARRQSIPRCRV